MRKLSKPVWLYVLEAAREFRGKPFTVDEIFNKVYEVAPRVKEATVRANIYGMTPNHPSSRLYPSILKNQAIFDYLGNGLFQMHEYRGSD